MGETLIRRHLTITGVVQGVGFRPHVARIAARYPVTGLCGNDDNSVFIEVQGVLSDVESFLVDLVGEAPPLSSILSVTATDLAVVGDEPEFIIVASRRATGPLTLIPADGAICADCLADMADPNNRRFRYPFTTCTNCGPRLSIIRDLPYDRPFTTMAEFPMCDACAGEYKDADDRRFHAQPISCFDCGPNLWLEVVGHDTEDSPSPDRRRGFEEVISAARQMVAAGKILAVKGIGGFTLMCDARNEEAVATLRTRKRRPGKPLAVMAGSVEAARSIACLEQAHLDALTGREAPIVLAPMATTYDLAASVAPGLDDVGVMLAYAPVHRLLLDEVDILVATSANSSSKPLTYLNDDARRDLSSIVDAFLMHDRGIFVPVEDSVVMTDGDGLTPIRRSRGYAPLPVFLAHGNQTVLAVGAELKNTFALTRNSMAFLSAHIGDMGSLETQAAYEKSVDQMLRAHRRTPDLIVVDKHPGYATHGWGKRYAEKLGVPVLEIQHHHGHALSLVAEGELTGPCVCLVLDGTGYGDDGTIWGGELLGLSENLLTFDRVGHLPGFWLPGGDSAVRHPWKSALGVVWEYGISPENVSAWSQHSAHSRAGQPTPEELDTVTSQLVSHINVARTTSTGRLFDAAASILGICHQITYEAQAAMELEATARRCTHDHQPKPADIEALFSLLIQGFHEGQDVRCLARIFHRGLAYVFATMVETSAPDTTAVGLTGGVFANRLLTADLTDNLRRAGHTVVGHRIVPANDGGLALGQALAGTRYLRDEQIPG
ncbi:MAG: carbamoyltransferase HypF [Propionibacteriaceae bacterium]|nr:carbamoyltransferase HypF [Propionibacteriaceae bacterium]